MESEFERAKVKAMDLLLYRDRTKKELNDRLLKAGFSGEAVTNAVSYVEGYGYIDDLRYATQYISFQRESRSQKEISYKLQQRGVEKEVIQEAFEGYEGDDAALDRMIAKRLKGKGLQELERQERDKIIAYLCRKGYSLSLVLKRFQNQND